MDRRNFIRLTVAGSAAGIIAPKTVLAGSSSMAGGLYYTKDAPGRWGKKIAGHIPNVKVSKGSKGTAIQVVTSHGMEGFDHYIVKHVLLDQGFNFVSEQMFNPMHHTVAVSGFVLGDYQGPLHVLSVCNKHDTWMNVVEI